MQSGPAASNFSVGQPQSSAAIDAQFQSVCITAEKCVQLVRNLRNGIVSAHEFLSSGFESEADLEQFKAGLEKFSKEIAEEYDKLEAEAKLLPAQTPPFTMTNRLNNFLLDVATNTSSLESYFNSRDAFDWSSSTSEYINVVYEFLKSSGGNQRGKKPLTQAFNERALTQHSVLENPHRRFEEIFRVYMKGQESQRLHYQYKYLERSTISSILEIKLVSMPSNRDSYVPVDKQGVCMLKMLLLVNNGIFEFIQFVAPHEDWTYLETNKRQIDLSVESRYEIYQRLSIQGNIVIHMISSQSAYDKNGINVLMNLVAKFYMLDQPCRQCKKILRDFSPATISDNRKFFYHLTCR